MRVQLPARQRTRTVVETRRLDGWCEVASCLGPHTHSLGEVGADYREGSCILGEHGQELGRHDWAWGSGVGDWPRGGVLSGQVLAEVD